MISSFKIAGLCAGIKALFVLATRGLACCALAFSSYGKHGLLIVVAFLVAKPGLSSFSIWAQDLLPCDLWNLSGPGIQLMSPVGLRQILNHGTTRGLGSKLLRRA